MKIRLADRILAAVVALCLLAVVLVIGAEAFFSIPVLQKLSAALVSRTVVSVLVLVAGILSLAILCAFCFCFALRREKKTDFVEQQAEEGKLRVSMKALEALVGKCLLTHREIQSSAVRLSNARDGLVIDVDAEIGADLSMPLVVSAVQKQIKEYITACTGVDVKEVRVNVNEVQDMAAASAFALPETIAIGGRLTNGQALQQRLCEPEDATVEEHSPAAETEAEAVLEQEAQGTEDIEALDAENETISDPLPDCGEDDMQQAEEHDSVDGISMPVLEIPLTEEARLEDLNEAETNEPQHVLSEDEEEEKADSDEARAEEEASFVLEDDGIQA